jgi:hypothetical protein
LSSLASNNQFITCNFPNSVDEAAQVADEASEVLQENDSSTASLLPEPERSKALARVMALLSKRGSTEVERVSEARSPLFILSQTKRFG